MSTLSIESAVQVLGFVRGQEFSHAQLRKAYRTLSRFWHPDSKRSKKEKEKAHEKIILIQAAYTALKDLAKEDIQIAGARTVDGVPLSELGKGYPITEAAKECEKCEGKGYQSFTGSCGSCHGFGWVSVVNEPCRRCKGTGSYSVRGKVIGTCRVCGGLGRFIREFNSPVKCRPCDGTGASRTGSNKLFMKCSECAGIGETRMWNPVLHRGKLGDGR